MTFTSRDGGSKPRRGKELQHYEPPNFFRRTGETNEISPLAIAATSWAASEEKVLLLLRHGAVSGEGVLHHAEYALKIRCSGEVERNGRAIDYIRWRIPTQKQKGNWDLEDLDGGEHLAEDKRTWADDWSFLIMDW